MIGIPANLADTFGEYGFIGLALILLGYFIYGWTRIDRRQDWITETDRRTIADLREEVRKLEEGETVAVIQLSAQVGRLSAELAALKAASERDMRVRAIEQQVMVMLCRLVHREYPGAPELAATLEALRRAYPVKREMPPQIAELVNELDGIAMPVKGKKQ